MKAKIAVATVSGKAYYMLVNELKKKNVSFLSLKPSDNVPLDIKVVLTTRKERPKINHQNVLEYENDKDPSDVVDEAIRTIKGKKRYDKLVVGVDPGRSFGIAVLGDGKILETQNSKTLDATVNVIDKVSNRISATHTTIRIGNGAPSYAKNLFHRLNDVLPSNVIIESVGEEGTSQSLGETKNRRGRRDVTSAMKIGQRSGQVLPRTKKTSFRVVER